MPAKWNQWDWDYLWHDLGGFGINGLVIVIMVVISGPWWAPFLVPPIVGAGGYVREKDQHDWLPLTGHQWLEAILWGVGALQAALVGLVFLI